VPTDIGLIGEHMKTARREIIRDFDALQPSPLGKTFQGQPAPVLHLVGVIVKVQELPQVVP
jgi:hypothetical protein